jgi:hypothetical protein
MHAFDCRLYNTIPGSYILEACERAEARFKTAWEKAGLPWLGELPGGRKRAPDTSETVSQHPPAEVIPQTRVYRGTEDHQYHPRPVELACVLIRHGLYGRLICAVGKRDWHVVWWRVFSCTAKVAFRTDD